MKKPTIIEQMKYKDLLDEIPCLHQNILPEKEYKGINIHEQIGNHEVTKIDKVAGMTTLTMTPLVIKTEDVETISAQIMIPKGIRDTEREELKGRDFTKLYVPEKKEYFLTPQKEGK